MSTKRQLVTPRTLKGFRDYLPQAMIPREAIIETARRVYQSYGFAPIDTPALEYLEILTGKGSDETDKQMYRFEDHGGRQVGMRFDLTIPLARFVAQHKNDLVFPLKRYHIASVWRGENTQRGRYREFMQCDFDTIGTESIVADTETALVIHDLMRAIGFEGFVVRINNRKVLSGLLEKLELAERSTEILRALDKLAKIGRERVAAEMTSAAGCSEQQAESVLALAELSGTNDAVLAELETLVSGNETGLAGVAALRDVLAGVSAAGVDSAKVRLDVSIARGLDYYTGTIFETFLDELPAIGSVCSGGRYDNLVDVYSKEHLPGIGASLGLDRLLAAMEELGRIEDVRTPAEVFIPLFAAERLSDYLRLAATLRAASLRVAVYPEAKKLGKQLQYADRQGFRVAVIVGDSEFADGRCQLKDLASGEQQDIALDDDAAALISAIKQTTGQ
ncbi:MAG: histidine--tRNA ligase [Pirellulales bacterium]|nr:histidine--tRNA ligase [Pirellulales bacterium]